LDRGGHARLEPSRRRAEDLSHAQVIRVTPSRWPCRHTGHRRHIHDFDSRSSRARLTTKPWPTTLTTARLSRPHVPTKVPISQISCCGAPCRSCICRRGQCRRRGRGTRITALVAERNGSLVGSKRSGGASQRLPSQISKDRWIADSGGINVNGNVWQCPTVVIRGSG